MKIYVLSYIFVAATLAGCGHDRSRNKLEDCPYGKPVAVFHGDMPGISRHEFYATPYDATEQFLLDSTIQVTLIQSGCEKPIQEFRFGWQKEVREFSNAEWTSSILLLLKRLATLDPKTAPLNAWAQAIEGVNQGWIPGEAREIQPGTFVSMDKITDGQEVILILVLGANP